MLPGLAGDGGRLYLPGMSDQVPGRRCPICQKPMIERFRPFCSKRCADVDLNRWLTGSYVVAGSGDDDEADRPDKPGGLAH